MNNQVYIYSLSCPFSGMARYVGMTTRTPQIRFKEHLKSNTKSHRDYWIKSVIKKGSTPVIDEIDKVDINSWVFWEQHYISLYKSWGFDLVNKTHGGEGGIGIKMSDEQKKKISDLRKLYFKNNPDKKPNVNDYLTPEKRRAAYDKLKGRKASDAIRMKMSKSRAGMKLKFAPKPGKAKKVNQFDRFGNFLKQWDSVTLAAESLNTSQTAISNSIIRKICCVGYMWSFSAQIEPVNHNRNRAIIHIQTGEVYTSIREAARKLKMDSGGINKVVSGHWPKYRNQTFKYADSGQAIDKNLKP